jgi:RNA polymerase sigma-70 factor (ECF subfamily)
MVEAASREAIPPAARPWKFQNSIVLSVVRWATSPKGSDDLVVERSASEFETLLAAAKANAEWAWRDIVNDFGPELRRFLEFRGSEPDDTLGDVFASMVRDIDRFTGDEAAFRGWLYRIAHNRLVDEHRRVMRRPQTVSDDLIDLPIQERQHDAGVVELLSNLPLEQRTVVFLRACLDLPFEEVADVVGKRVGATKMIYRRGLDQLGEKLRDFSPLPDA